MSLVHYLSWLWPTTTPLLHQQASAPFPQLDMTEFQEHGPDIEIVTWKKSTGDKVDDLPRHADRVSELIPRPSLFPLAPNPAISLLLVVSGCPLLSLPAELLLMVLSYLGPRDWKSLCLVNKELSSLAQSLLDSDVRVRATPISLADHSSPFLLRLVERLAENAAAAAAVTKLELSLLFMRYSLMTPELVNMEMDMRYGRKIVQAAYRDAFFNSPVEWAAFLIPEISPAARVNWIMAIAEGKAWAWIGFLFLLLPNLRELRVVLEDPLPVACPRDLVDLVFRDEGFENFFVEAFPAFRKLERFEVVTL